MLYTCIGLLVLSTLNFSFKWSALCLITVYAGNGTWTIPTAAVTKVNMLGKERMHPPSHTPLTTGQARLACCSSSCATCEPSVPGKGDGCKVLVFTHQSVETWPWVISSAGGRSCVATTFSQRHQPVKRTKTSRLAWDVEIIRVGGSANFRTIDIKNIQSQLTFNFVLFKSRIEN